MEKKVVLAWGSRKRHIFIDKELLCKTRHNPGYSKGGHYNSYDLDSDVFEYRMKSIDTEYSHYQGIIKFVPLKKQKIILSSVCKKCQKEYEKLLSNIEVGKDI